MTEFLADWLRAVWVILVESGPYLLLGFIIAGFIKVLVPEERVFKYLGKNDFRSVFVASCCGVPIPLCSCSVIPTAMSLRRSGASKGATTSFMISTPETGVDSIGITWALMDPIMTIARPLAAFATALGAGTSVNLLVRRGLDRDPARASATAPIVDGGAAVAPVPSGPSCADEHDHVHEETRPRGFRATVKAAFRYAFGPLLDDLAPWLLYGFVLSGLIVLLVPDDLFREADLPRWVAMLAMLVVGVPLYICASAATPVAAALVAKGLDPGAALVLLLAGPASSIATMMVVRGFLGGRVLVVYLASISSCALLFGYAVSGIYRLFGIDPVTTVAPVGDAGEYGLLSFQGLAGFLLLALFVRSAVRIRLLRLLAQQLRGWFRPIGFDPVSPPMKFAAAAALLAMYLATAVTVLEPGQTAFVTRFGAVRQTLAEPGAHLHLPYPFEAVEVVEQGRVRGLEFGFEAVPRAAAAASDRERRRELEAEAEIITGNGNLLSATYTTHYRVRDAYRYRYGVADPDALMRALVESSLREALAGRASDDVLLADRDELQDAVRSILQDDLDALDAGVVVVAIHLLDVHAPPQTHYAYRNVASELERKEEQIRRAEGDRSRRLAQARGRAFTIEQQAAGNRAQRVAAARGRAAAFLARLEAYAREPAAARFLLRLQATEEIYPAVRLILNLARDVEVVPVPAGAGGPPPLQDAGKERTDR